MPVKVRRLSEIFNRCVQIVTVSMFVFFDDRTLASSLLMIFVEYTVSCYSFILPIGICGTKCFPFPQRQVRMFSVLFLCSANAFFFFWILIFSFNKQLSRYKPRINCYP